MQDLYMLCDFCLTQFKILVRKDFKGKFCFCNSDVFIGGKSDENYTPLLFRYIFRRHGKNAVRKLCIIENSYRSEYIWVSVTKCNCKMALFENRYVSNEIFKTFDIDSLVLEE